MININIPKNEKEQVTASACVYYRAKKLVAEKQQLLLAEAKLAELRKSEAIQRKIEDTLDEIELRRQNIRSRKQMCRQVIARGYEMWKILKARRIPNVLEYFGVEMKKGAIVGAVAEMCDGDAKTLIPQPGEELSLVEKKRRLDVVEDIVDALIPLHIPLNSPRSKNAEPVFCVCDLKTDNIFLKGNHALLGDLSGIVKEGDPVRELSQVYAPPGKDIGTCARHEDDIYALGLIGCELFHGKLEILDKTFAKLDAHDSIDKLFIEMFNKNPMARPSATTVKMRLEQIKTEIQRSLPSENMLKPVNPESPGYSGHLHMFASLSAPPATGSDGTEAIASSSSCRLPCYSFVNGDTRHIRLPMVTMSHPRSPFPAVLQPQEDVRNTFVTSGK